MTKINANLKAFTGMMIQANVEGTLNLENTIVSITTKTGSTLYFDRQGTQINATKPQYANKLEILTKLPPALPMALEAANKPSATGNDTSKKYTDKNQKRALNQIKHAFNWIVGGYENSITDGYITEMPSHDALVEEIYDGIMNNTYGEGSQSSRAINEIRFCGTEWLKSTISAKLTKEGL